MLLSTRRHHIECALRFVKCTTKVDLRAVSRTVGADYGSLFCNGGAEEDRTPDLLRARQALSQLSYGPENETAHRGGSGWI